MAQDGQVNVLMNISQPYQNWFIVTITDNQKLKLFGKVPFEENDYPGYHPSKGCYPNPYATLKLHKPFTFILENSDIVLDEVETVSSVTPKSCWLKTTKFMY